jgi:hypothetical protein
LVIAEAFLSCFGLDHSSVHVSHHYPEDFRDAFEEIAGRNSFPFGGCNFRLRCWSPRDHATRAAMRFYVHLSLEGLPLHLWSESFAAKVFGRSCLLHFAKEHYRRESTDTFELMAWTADLAAIPLWVWHTVTDPDQGVGGSLQVVHRQRPSELKRGMVYDVLLHISSILDTRRLGADGRPLLYQFHFNLGMMDADQSAAPRRGGQRRMRRPAIGASKALLHC